MIFNITTDEVGTGGIPVDPESLTPFVFGFDANGFYMSDNEADATEVYFGGDAGGFYVTDGVTE